MRNGFGWWHRAVQVVLAAVGATPSYANSTLTAASATGTADGSTGNTLTLTVRDTTNAVMQSQSVTFTTELTVVSAGQTTLVDDAAEIETTTGVLNLILVCKNADGTPLPNIQSARIVYASTGTGNTFGTPSVTDKNGQSLCTFSSTVAEAKTISVTVDGVAVTQTCAVTVTGTPSLLTPIFQSDFGTTTGTSSNAYLDGGAWDRVGGYGHEVVASTGLDFPSTNTCRFDANYSNSGFCLTQVDLTALAVGVTRYHRLYVRMTFPDELVGNGDHPWQDGNAVGDSNYLLGVGYGSADSPTHDGDWRLSVIIIEDLGSIICVGPWLAKGTTYRVEWAVERIDTSTYNFDIRVYDTAGVLLYGSSDFAPQFGGGTLASRGPYTFKAAQEASPGDFFNCGTNDFETAGNDWWNAAPYSGVFAYGYQGCFAVCEDQGWIGAYGSVTGEA